MRLDGQRTQSQRTCRPKLKGKKFQRCIPKDNNNKQKDEDQRLYITSSTVGGKRERIGEN